MNGIYSVSEAAKILGITRQGVNKAIKKGNLIADKLGFYYIIKEEDLINYKNSENRKHSRWAKKRR